MAKTLRYRSRSAATVAQQTAPVRCAVYTRKSTDEGLDKDFNSLDNQRERSEAYLASQGWAPISTRYDDGGFSGGNVDRPAFQRLLTDVEAGLVDTVVCYRLDRISRSLVDFVKVHEFLEKHGVALVSVTESIDTSSPHGRMMVNVLLSFAQYERELIAERTRHKIEAARRRGKWTGGRPSLGYDVAPEGGRLVVNKDEADQVKAIFALYAEDPSLVGVCAKLNRRGWKQKSWTTKSGKQHEGGPWNRVTLARLLKDPVYIGKMKLGDEVFAGEHTAVVPKKLFDKVQRLMDENRSTGGASTRNKHGALLRGLLHCSACDAAMVHAPTKARGRLHRYYRCSHAMKAGAESCPSKPLRADKVEQFVVEQIRRIGADAKLQEETFHQAVAQVKAQRRGLKLERKRLTADLNAARKDVERLVATISRLHGPASDAIASELGKAQERVGTLETRQTEIQVELADLDKQNIDRDELARALEAFDPIWDVLLTPEKERVLQLLIDRIDYDGSTKNLAITWRLAGFGQLADEVAP